MYDKIKVRANISVLTDLSYLNYIKSKMTNVKEVVKDGELILVVGNLKKLFLAIKPNYIIISGSLCKYYYGNNQLTLTLSDTEKAVKMLSHHLLIQEKQLKVYQMEVGTNIIVPYKHTLYYNFLGNARGYTKGMIGESLYYTNSLRKSVFYDKTKEQKKREETIIKPFRGKKLLRFEVRYMRDLAKQFNRTEITLKDLYDPDLFHKVVEKWMVEYFKIKRYKLVSFTEGVFQSVDEFRKQLLILGIKSLGGQDKIYKLINHAQLNGTFKNKMQRSRLIGLLNLLLANEVLMKQNEEIKYLDNQVIQIAEEFLSAQ